MKLYEIPTEIRRIEDQIIEAGGELTPEAEQELQELEAEFARKAEWIALMAKEADAEAATFKTEEDRLRERRRAAENRAARLKAYLHSQMAQLGESKIKGDLVTVAVQSNSRATVAWDPMTPIPDAFARIKRELDTQAVLDFVKVAGKAPEGATVAVGTHLRIR